MMKQNCCQPNSIEVQPTLNKLIQSMEKDIEQLKTEFQKTYSEPATVYKMTWKCLENLNYNINIGYYSIARDIWYQVYSHYSCF